MGKQVTVWFIDGQLLLPLKVKVIKARHQKYFQGWLKWEKRGSSSVSSNQCKYVNEYLQCLVLKSMKRAIWKYKWRGGGVSFCIFPVFFCHLSVCYVFVYICIHLNISMFLYTLVYTPFTYSYQLVCCVKMCTTKAWLTDFIREIFSTKGPSLIGRYQYFKQ